MSSRFMIFAVALAIFVAGAWMALQPPDLREQPASTAAAAASPAPSPGPATPEKLSASSVLAIDPRASSRKAALPVRPTLTGEFFAAKQYRTLYDRLKASAEGTTAEGAYVLYEIANRCATISDRPARRNFGNAAKPLEQRRDEFLAALQPTDPLREKRVAAFEEVNANRCLGFEGVTMTQADLNKMLANAVSLGDPKARALAIEQEINAARRGRWDPGTLTESQIDGLKQTIGTRDPAAMVTAGRLLSTAYGDLTMRVGPDGQVAEPRALYNAWQILACDYGYPCGETNDRLLQACAYQAHCDASSLPDYLHYYGSSPHDSQLIAQYQSILRTAIETGDWSQLNLVRGPRPPGAPRFQYVPPR